MTSGNMQINSRWPPVLQQHGISEQTLLDPCTNTYVGAWFLARNIERLSYGCPRRRESGSNSPA